MFMASARAPKQGQAEEQCDKAGNDRTDDISGGEAIGMAFDQQCGIEREGRESREPAEDAGGEEQPHVLGDARAEGEIAGQQAHRERAGDVDDQRPERKTEAEQPGAPR